MPIVITDKIKVDNKNAILGFKNMEAIITTAGIGITYGENPVGSSTPVAHAIIAKTAERDK